MKRESDVKELLIANAIRLIAEGGFEKATTKELAYSGGHLNDFKMNEVYIYRYFGSKEALYEAAFMRLDREFYNLLMNEATEIGDFEDDTREKLYRYFLKVWSFLLGNEVKCRCYVRYYYSVYFKGASKETHKQHYKDMANAISPIFKKEADIVAILHSVFIMLFDFAIRVYNGEIDNNEVDRYHVFNVLYCMMVSYFNETVNV